MTAEDVVKNDEAVESTASQDSNDNSNPQQGTFQGLKDQNIQHRQLKIPPTEVDDRKLFVGGLPPDVTSEEFRLFFEQFGAILDSVVMFDRETKNSRGFGFVTFADPEVSKSLLKIGSQEEGIGRLDMRGKTCEVKRAEPKHHGRQSKSKLKIQQPYPRYMYDGYMTNNSMQPFPYSVPVYAGYMTPMYYPYPPNAVSPAGDFASPAPMHPSPYIMTHAGTDPYLTTHPLPSSNIAYMHHLPPVVSMMPDEMLAQQNAQSSAMHPVAPGIPTKVLDDSSFEHQTH